VIYMENGVCLREKEILGEEGNKTNKIEYLEEVEARWLEEKEAIEDVLSYLFPRLLERHPLLIRGGVCMAQHDTGVARTLPAAFGLDEEIDDMNMDLGYPHDIYGYPIEPILNENEVELIAGALYRNSLEIAGSVMEEMFGIDFSDGDKDKLMACLGYPEAMEKCIVEIENGGEHDTA